MAMTVSYWPQVASPSIPTGRLFTDYNFLKPMANSLLVVASLTTIISVIVSLLAAYSLSRATDSGAGSCS